MMKTGENRAALSVAGLTPLVGYFPFVGAPSTKLPKESSKTTHLPQRFHGTAEA